MFKNLTDILSADCEVVKFNTGQFFYPIFKNGRSSLTKYAGRNNLPLLKNKEISNLKKISSDEAKQLNSFLTNKSSDIGKYINQVSTTEGLIKKVDPESNFKPKFSKIL